MAVEGRQKAILAGRWRFTDLVADPRETANLVSQDAPLAAAGGTALRDYPVPSPEAGRAPEAPDGRGAAQSGEPRLRQSERRRPSSRKDAPRPADMAGLFDVIDQASGLFVAGEVRAR